jgi:hypothetical protein
MHFLSDPGCLSDLKIAKTGIISEEYSQCVSITCVLLRHSIASRHTIPAPEIVGGFKFITCCNIKTQTKMKV